MQYPKLLIVSALIILFTTITGYYMYQGIVISAEEIISDNKNITRTAAAKLVLEGERSIPPVWNEHLKGINKITKAEERVADSLLSHHVREVLSNFHRVEGGFYFKELDGFIGYSFPTISEPKPAFGPPPRSYNIIREQVRFTILNDTIQTELHQFDPAVFPLTTQPVYMDGEIIGAVWARIHIERKLAASQNFQSGTFFLTVGSILLGLAVAILIVMLLRKRIAEIKEGLQEMKKNPDYRLKEHRGVLGFISREINDMTDTRQKEQENRERLERQLFQKEKMASLGNLVAGTAHEINTPISIIKTRIQIWERKLQQLQSGENKPLITDKSLHIVHTEIERVSSLIKRLLLFSKPAGKKRVPVDVHTLLQEKITWLKEAFPRKEIIIESQFDSELPPVPADRESIDQVFMNILKNAVEASGETCKILIQTRLIEKKLAEIRIQDFGEGMSHEIQDKIFEPFFTTKDRGSGLGLSISHEIVKAHHGTIFFETPRRNGRSLNQQNGYITPGIVPGADPLFGTICIIRLPIMN